MNVHFLAGSAAMGVLAFFLTDRCEADLVTFELQSTNPPSLDEKPTGKLTIDGLTGTFTVNTGKINGTASYWGINAEPGGDVTDQIDGGAGIDEVLSISFDQDITVESFAFSSSTDDDIIDLTLGANAVRQLSDPGSEVFTENHFVSAGESVDIAHREGNGVSLDAFQVRTATATPEPSALAFSLFLAGTIGLRRCRRRATRFFRRPQGSV